MAQTTETSKVFFPDGCKVSVKGAGESVYTDVGAISTAVNATLNWDENQVESANAGTLRKQIRNMRIDGGFTLINLNPEGVNRMGAGVFTLVTTAGSEVTTGISDQVIAEDGWASVAPVALVLDNGSTHKLSAVPTITSVTGSVDGLLDANDDYVIIADSNSPSGYSIVLNTAGTNLTTVEQDITIVYSAFTPVASTALYAGSSTAVLSGFAMKITHTDDNGLIRELELFSVNSNSGGFQFNFKGANEDGTEEMPITYTANIDITRTSGQQLMKWVVEEGAA